MESVFSSEGGCIGQSLTKVVASIIDSIVCSESAFGLFVQRFLYAEPTSLSKRIRDIFPMPRLASMTAFDVPAQTKVPRQVFLDYCNMWLAGLAFMAGEQSAAIDRHPTKLQLAVQQRVVLKLCRFLQRLDVLLTSCPMMSFGAFVGRGESNYLPLQADSVDGLVKCGLVDPLHFVGDDVQGTVTTPNQMFPIGVKSVGLHATVGKGDRHEYIRLLVKHLRTGKVRLSGTAVANASVFVVGMAGGAKQREILSGNVISALAKPPPKPPLLVSPSALVHLETVETAPFWLAKKDGTCFFDQLRLDPSLQDYMGRPQVRLSELVGVDGMTASEARSFVTGGDIYDLVDVMTPVNGTWAMGFAGSSFVAQSVMTGYLCFVQGFQLRVSSRARIKFQTEWMKWWLSRRTTSYIFAIATLTKGVI